MQSLLQSDLISEATVRARCPLQADWMRSTAALVFWNWACALSMRRFFWIVRAALRRRARRASALASIPLAPA